ncbi:hypothetical protein LJC38_01590 [Parabacteroides sp. OttesenSCG-928-K15]|nr:hypothetical protein [Parabacteroides sp. OttesenSCG-928-K15]
MKKKKLFAFVGILAALFTVGCTDDTPIRPIGGEENPREVTFEFPNTTGSSVIYAIATESENELKTLDVYVFREDTLSTANPKPMLLEDIHQSGVNIPLTTSGTNKTTTLTLARGEKKYFYFVGNGRDHLSPKDVILDKTTAKEFEAKTSALLDAKGHIQAPLLMTGFVEIPKVSDLISPTGGQSKSQVKLTRRMVRFDIFNNADESDFVIEEILISNARQGVNLFEIVAADWPTKDNPQRPIVKYNAPKISKMESIDFLQHSNANHGLSNSVFYLYPTVDAGETTIELVGKDLATGNPQVYPVYLRSNQQQDATKFNIEANTRYTLNILSKGIGYINATLMAEDWKYDPDNDVEVPADYGIIKLSKADGTAIDKTNNTIEVAAENTVATPTTIKVEAESEWEAVVPDEFKDWLFTNQDQLTDGEIHTEFTFWTKEDNPSSLIEREGVIEIRNKNRTSIVQPLVVKQAKNTTRYINYSGYVVDEGVVVLMGEKSQPLTINIDVPATASWTADTQDTWIGLAATKATSAITGPGKLVITPEANPKQDEPRDGFITITVDKGSDATDLVCRIPVRQALSNLGSITLSGAGVKEDTATKNYTLDAPAFGFPDANGKRLVRVFAHTAWEVTSSETWAKISGVRTEPGFNNGAFYIEVEELMAGPERTATITIVNKTDDTIKKEITLKQLAPTISRPELENFVMTNAPGTWDATNMIYDFSDNQQAKFTFTVKSAEASYYTIDILHDKTGKTLGLDDQNSKAYRDLIIIKSTTPPAEGTTDPTVQEVEINVPQQAADTRVPVDVVIYVRNNKNNNYYRTITLRNRPVYNGMAGMDPVLVGGRFWAPVNVGQTTLDGSATASLASWGNLFQWGRNTAFNPETFDSTNDVVDGPLSYNDAMADENKDKFIKLASGNDWLATDDPKTNERNKLWSPEVNNSPCPKGWRVPTKAELEILKGKASGDLYNEQKFRTEIPGDESGKFLYLPHALGKAIAGSNFSHVVSNVYWSSSHSSANDATRWFFHKIDNWSSNIVNSKAAYAFSLRCIQEQ